MNTYEEYRNRRQSDIENEKTTIEFLKEDVLNKFPTFEMIFDKTHQKEGIDFQFFGRKNFFYMCDLKTIMPRANGKKLETACLECASRHFDKEKKEWIYNDGWYLDKKKKTNTYVMFWIDECTNGLKNKEDIKEYEYCFILVETIREYLKSNGWDETALRKKVEEIKNNPENYYKTQWIEDKKSGFKIGFNTPERFYDSERPINILLSRSFYIKNAIYHKSSTDDNV